MWHVYIVECADGTYYTGITTDVDRRINEHNYSFRSAKYTRSRRPVRLVYVSSQKIEVLHLEERVKLKN